MGINNPSGGASLWVVVHDETLAAPGNFDVSGIEQIYSVLKFYLLSRSDVVAEGDGSYVFINGDTTLTNYRYQQLQTTGVAATVTQGDLPNLGGTTGASATANYFGYALGSIFNYTNTTIFKQVEITNLQRRTATAEFTRYLLTHWENTDAITQLTFQPDDDDFIAGSRLLILGATE